MSPMGGQAMPSNTSTPTIQQLAAVLDISEPTLRRRIRDGSIVGVGRSLTGRYRLPNNAAEQIIAFYRNQEQLAD